MAKCKICGKSTGWFGFAVCDDHGRVKYRDRVLVIDGFFKGQKGVVEGSGFKNEYPHLEYFMVRLDNGRYFDIHPSCLAVDPDGTKDCLGWVGRSKEYEISRNSPADVVRVINVFGPLQGYRGQAYDKDPTAGGKPVGPELGTVQVTRAELIRMLAADAIASGDAFFSDLVFGEIEKARARNAPINSAHEGFAVIAEELDEFWDEVRKRRSQHDPVRMLAELVQVAAMCQRTAEDLGLLNKGGFDGGEKGTGAC